MWCNGGGNQAQAHVAATTSATAWPPANADALDAFHPFYANEHLDRENLINELC